MTSAPDEPQESTLEAAELGDGLTDEAPEADVLEQHLPSGDYDLDPAPPNDVPTEADPADVAEQHRSAGDGDADEYR
jgi:hypothetical protein